MTADALIDEITRSDSLDSTIRAAQAGDGAAFEELMVLNERRVAQIAWAILGDAEDVKAVDSRPIFYTYKLRRITVGEEKVDIGNFEFSMRVPLDLGGGSIQYQSVGFETPVAVKQGEKVVIGTTTMNDKALVVVVTAKVN